MAIAGAQALVTGASSGFGRAIALALAEAGAAVLGTGRDRAALAALERAAPAGRVRTVAGDLRDPDHLASLAEAAGPVDILVNNAGAIHIKPFLDAEPGEWSALMEINLMVPLRLSQSIARGMAARGRGHIVFISSMLARQVKPNTVVYAATKHALAAAARGLRAELKAHGIRVTEIAPGLGRTQAFRDVAPEVRQRYAARAFRWLEPQDVAGAVLYALAAPPEIGLDVIEINPAMQD